MRFFPPQTIVSPLQLVRRERMLPAPGEILVNQGERVDPVQVIGVAYAPGEFRIVDASHDLRASIRTLRRHIQVKVGQEVARGEVLASKGGVFGLGKNVCRAPITGRVTGIGSGKILIETSPQEIKVRSGYSGTVSEVFPGRGVAIVISGALVQAAWGNGQEGDGVLRVAVKGRDKPLKARTIDPSFRGAILIGGSTFDEQALERAMELQVRGIIVGAIPAEMIEQAEAMPFPVAATEGIGTSPMSGRIFSLLSTHDGREAVLDGRFKGGREIHRPEVIIALPAEPGTGELELPDEPLKPGDRVRATRKPYKGVTGTVLSLPTAAVRIATGARLSVAKIQPEDEGEPLLVPVINLEVLR